MSIQAVITNVHINILQGLQCLVPQSSTSVRMAGVSIQAGCVIEMMTAETHLMSSVVQLHVSILSTFTFLNPSLAKWPQQVPTSHRNLLKLEKCYHFQT